MGGKQGSNGIAPGGVVKGFLKHHLSPSAYLLHCGSLSGTRTWLMQNHNRQPAVVQVSSPWFREEHQEHLCAAEGSEAQRWPGRRQFIQTGDGPERVESSIQNRNIQRKRGLMTDRRGSTSSFWLLGGCNIREGLRTYMKSRNSSLFLGSKANHEGRGCYPGFLPPEATIGNKM